MSSQTSIRGLLFDKDGTLIDFNRTWFEVTMDLARTAAGGDEASARTLLDRGGYDWTRQSFRSGSVVAAGTVEDIVDLWHPAIAVAERLRLIAAYDSHARSGAARSVAIDGLHATLDALAAASFVLGIATNDSEAGARETADALGITQSFAAIIGYDSVARPKPYPDQIYLFAETTGLAPSEIAMIGDNPHDLEMARAAGAGLAIGVLSGNSTRSELAHLSDVILDSVADLPAYFAGR